MNQPSFLPSLTLWPLYSPENSREVHLPLELCGGGIIVVHAETMLSDDLLCTSLLWFTNRLVYFSLLIQMLFCES